MEKKIITILLLFSLVGIFIVSLSMGKTPVEENIDSDLVESAQILSLTDNNFANEISKGITVVDFWATWCMPCRLQDPILRKTAAELKGKVAFGKVDIDKNFRTANKYYIQAVPTIIIFKDGKIAKRLIGVQQKNQLIQEINSLREEV